MTAQHHQWLEGKWEDHNLFNTTNRREPPEEIRTDSCRLCPCTRFTVRKIDTGVDDIEEYVYHRESTSFDSREPKCWGGPNP